MVTLRRDISTRDITNDFPHGEMTDYDRFMLGKKNAESHRNTVYTGNGQLTAVHEAPKALGSYSDYHEYMVEQLNRTAPEKMVSEAEFYMDRHNSSRPASDVKKPRAKRKMTRAGKIFTAVYVLIVAALASIIIAVNVDKEDVNAEAGATGGEIAALSIERETNEGNAFDEILDALSNK